MDVILAVGAGDIIDQKWLGISSQFLFGVFFSGSLPMPGLAATDCPGKGTQGQDLRDLCMTILPDSKGHKAHCQKQQDGIFAKGQIMSVDVLLWRWHIRQAHLRR